MQPNEEMLSVFVTEMRRGAIALAVLSRLGEPGYGYQLVRDLARGGVPVAGTVKRTGLPGRTPKMRGELMRGAGGGGGVRMPVCSLSGPVTGRSVAPSRRVKKASHQSA